MLRIGHDCHQNSLDSHKDGHNGFKDGQLTRKDAWIGRINDHGSRHDGYHHSLDDQQNYQDDREDSKQGKHLRSHYNFFNFLKNVGHSFRRIVHCFIPHV